MDRYLERMLFSALKTRRVFFLGGTKYYGRVFLLVGPKRQESLRSADN